MLILMISLIVVGLTRMAAIHQHLEDIVSRNVAKREVALRMNVAILERRVSMHSLIVMTDPFDQLEESDRMRNSGAKVFAWRQQLEALATSAEEVEILARLREQMVKTRPLAEQVGEELMAGDYGKARITILTQAIPQQAAVARLINEFIDLQQREMMRVVAEAGKAYAEAQRLMFTFGALVGVLSLLISVVVIRNTLRQARSLQHQALFDSLTDLPNRALFDDRLQQAILIARREKRNFGLIAMDLDRFKEINDTLGHHVGDLELQHVAACTRHCLRESDTVARMGGDEFTILLATVGDLDDVVSVAKKLLVALRTPVQVAGRRVEIGASLGAAMFPLHGEDPDLLMREADAAMYAAKQAHSGYRVYSAELGHGVDDHQALRGELSHAIANQELVLHFQPKIDFHAERVSGVEALVRWQHPQHGLIGLIGIGLEFFKEGGWLKTAFAWLFESTTHMIDRKSVV